MEDLPDEILCLIFSQVPASDLLMSGQLVCWRWKDLIKQDCIWRHRALRYNPGRVSTYIDQVEDEGTCRFLLAKAPAFKSVDCTPSAFRGNTEKIFKGVSSLHITMNADDNVSAVARAIRHQLPDLEEFSLCIQGRCGDVWAFQAQFNRVLEAVDMSSIKSLCIMSDGTDAYHQGLIGFNHTGSLKQLTLQSSSPYGSVSLPSRYCAETIIFRNLGSLRHVNCRFPLASELEYSDVIEKLTVSADMNLLDLDEIQSLKDLTIQVLKEEDMQWVREFERKSTLKKRLHRYKVEFMYDDESSSSD